MERSYLILGATLFVCLGLILTRLEFGTPSWLDVFVIPVLSFLLAWPAVVYFDDLRNAHTAQTFGAELAPRLKTTSFLNIGFVLSMIREQSQSLMSRMDPVCEK
jgi:hypothetical protein